MEAALGVGAGVGWGSLSIRSNAAAVTQRWRVGEARCADLQLAATTENHPPKVSNRNTAPSAGLEARSSTGTGEKHKQAVHSGWAGLLRGAKVAPGQLKAEPWSRKPSRFSLRLQKQLSKPGESAVGPKPCLNALSSDSNCGNQLLTHRAGFKSIL